MRSDRNGSRKSLCALDHFASDIRLIRHAFVGGNIWQYCVVSDCDWPVGFVGYQFQMSQTRCQPLEQTHDADELQKVTTAYLIYDGVQRTVFMPFIFIQLSKMPGEGEII